MKNSAVKDHAMTGKQCSTCGYVRDGMDNLPDWKCPRCDTLYERPPVRSDRGRRSELDFTDIPMDGGYRRRDEKRRNPLGRIFFILVMGIGVIGGSLYLFADRARYVNEGEAALFVSQACGEPCDELADFLVKREVPLRVYTVDTDPDARSLFDTLKGETVPFLVMGRFRITGFDLDRVDHAISETFQPMIVGENGAVDVVVFLSADCPGCRKMEAFLKKQGIDYTGYWIDEEPAHRKKFDEYGFKAVPAVIIGGKPVVGYNPRALKKMLRKAGLM